ncbi:MAG: ABC transporter substrate-binding protein [Thermoanaerobaculia bacterium]
MSLCSRHRWAAWAAVGIVASACAGGGETEGTPRLRWYVFREPSGAFARAAAECTRAARGRYRIEIAELPADADQQRIQIARRLAARDPDLDVLGLDVIWTAELAGAGWILPWDEVAPEAAESIRRSTLAAPLATATYRGRLYAAPFTTNVQLLWYRTDLVEEPPRTWAELIAASEALARGGEPHRAQVQGGRYEGLTVWFVSLLASTGGRVLEPGGGVALSPGPTREALAVMGRFARSAAAPPNLATTREDEARLAFEAGDSAFMLNYPFVWPSARENAPEISRVMGWAPWPRVDPERPARVAVGGLNLGIGAFSRHPELAAEAAACLRSDAHQLRAALEGGLFPTTAALYEGPELSAELPFLETFLETLRHATERPETPAYADLSLAIQRTLHPLRAVDPDATGPVLASLRERLRRAVRSRGLL